MYSARLMFLCCLTVSLGHLHAQASASLTSILSFTGPNGANPGGALVKAGDGNFYGTTAAGGAGGAGTLFRMTPPGGLETLFSFHRTNGANPGCSLALAPDGSMYGTTPSGGISNQGTIFRLTASGDFATLYEFTGTNGTRPRSDLLLAANGSLFGTTEIGGALGQGAAFEITPEGTFHPVACFDNSGYNPSGRLLQAADGNFYGTAFLGGQQGYGAIFKLTPGGTLTIPYSFSGGAGGANPYGGLIQGPDGALYGTTMYGGSGYGTAFKVSTDGAFTLLASFGGTNGAFPAAPLVLGADGAFYGTTQAGGANTNQTGSGYGTIFRLKPGGELVSLVSFSSTNGANPLAGLVESPSGTFYGTTANGGTADNGTIYRLVISTGEPPVILGIQAQAGGISATYRAVVGQKYQVVCRSDLGEGPWTSLGGQVVANDTVMTFTDIVGPGSQKFYRVVLLP